MAAPEFNLYAHSTGKMGEWQLLLDHLNNVADLAAKFASPFGDTEMAKFSGLLHDIGKATKSWQHRLEDLSENRHPKFDEIEHDHRMAGAMYAWSIGTPASKLISLPIAGHHMGIPNLKELGDRQLALLDEVRQHRRDPKIAEVERKLGDYLATVQSPDLPPNFLHWSPWQQFFYIIRLFSCLTDADCIDTGDHHGTRFEVPHKPPVTELYARMLEKFDALLKTEGVNEKTVAMRQHVLEACIAASALGGPIFSLNSPTGSGKTLGGIQFAVRHCMKYGKQRIIYIAPFRTVLDQTNDVYGKLLGNENILMHHSTADFWSRNEDDDRLRRQMAENWEEFPLILTTPEQFFESLFSSRPGASRKIHNMHNSIILMDEPQAIPLRVQGPVFQALRYLAKDFGCTLFFMTATMPPLEKLLEMPVQEVLLNKRREFKINRRVRVYSKKFVSVTPLIVAAFMAKENQACSISNTRADAYAIYLDLPRESRMYFSTYMCPAHRRIVLEDMRARLTAGSPLHVSATQALEAGVDVDFPHRFMREECPFDSGMQAAGRCARNRGGGCFYWFSLTSGNRLKDYDLGIEKLKVIQRMGLSPHDPTTMRKYYEMLYESRDLDTGDIATSVKNRSFEKVRNDFHILDDIQFSVVVRYGMDEQKRDIDQMVKTMRAIGAEATPTRSQRGQMRRAIRRIQPFVVPVYATAFEELQESGLIEDIGAGYSLFTGAYDTSVGMAAYTV